MKLKILGLRTTKNPFFRMGFFICIWCYPAGDKVAEVENEKK